MGPRPRRSSALLDDLVAAAGSALILSGDAGVGKSALLDFAGAGAAPQAVRVLRGAGTDLGIAHSFLALAQLLLPLRAELDGLPAEYRGVLQGTLGLRRATGEQPNRVARLQRRPGAPRRGGEIQAERY